MKSCEIVSEWLDAMVDDDLGPQEAAQVRKHIRACESCRADLDGLRAVKRAAKALPRGLSPSRDLWNEIETHIEAQPKPRRKLNLTAVAAAATVVAAIALGVLLAPSRGTAPPLKGETPPPALVHVRYETTPFGNIKAEYEQARNDLLEVIEARRDQLTPETLEVIDRNMQLIDQAIADIEQALSTSPGEPQLDRQLQLAYQQQIDLLRWAARLSA